MKKRTFSKIWASCMFTLVASLSFCASHTDNGAIIEGTDAVLNETARILAGKELSPNSGLYSFTQSLYYKQYRDEIHKGWNKFQRSNMENMGRWWEKQRPADNFETVLYPFSGPDLPHALAFFPDASTYIMFGLESPAPLLDVSALPEHETKKALDSIKASLGTIFHVNFFKTEGMAETLRNQKLNSIGTMLLFFLALHDYEIVSSRRIAIDKDGSVVPGSKSDDAIRWENPPKSWVPGIEISFRKNKGTVQRVRYYMLNVIDYSLEKFSPNFIPYLKKQAPWATVVKSASYLMHNTDVKFSGITKTVLAGSDYIVQDDSGIPLRCLTPGSWEIRFHGYYLRPISLFGHRYQPDLKKAMDEKSTGTLPFSYGYNFQAGKSNLMTAKRIRRD